MSSPSCMSSLYTGTGALVLQVPTLCGRVYNPLVYADVQNCLVITACHKVVDKQLSHTGSVGACCTTKVVPCITFMASKMEVCALNTQAWF
jgi:hypothetical protein